MLKQYNGLYNIDYKIQVIQCNECHLERCLSGKCSTIIICSTYSTTAKFNTSRSVTAIFANVSSLTYELPKYVQFISICILNSNHVIVHCIVDMYVWCRGKGWAL